MENAMEKNILIVDSDEAFALMLHDSIKREMHHHAIICTTATQAKVSLLDNDIDLVVIDMGLEDEDPLSLLQALRQRQNGMRVVVIPLMGEELPEEVANAGIQGVLTKPFFIGDLAATIEKALEIPLEPVPEEPPDEEPADTVAETPDDPPPAEVDVQPEPVIEPSSSAPSLDAGTIDIITDLHRETAAEAVILTGPTGIAAQSGEVRGLNADEAGQLLNYLSGMIADTLASFSGVEKRDQDVLHQGYCEGLGRRLYWMSLSRDWLLVCVLDIETPLGMLRYHLRRAASQLSAFAGE